MFSFICEILSRTNAYALQVCPFLSKITDFYQLYLPRVIDLGHVS